MRTHYEAIKEEQEPLRQRGMTLRLPEKVWKALIEKSLIQGCTVNNLIEDLLLEEFEEGYL